MTDIVMRLRTGVYGTNRIALCLEAADEIERLELLLRDIKLDHGAEVQTLTSDLHLLRRDRTATADYLGAAMKRYEHFCSYDGGGPADPLETEDGEWVRYSDAVALVTAERKRNILVDPEVVWFPEAAHLPDTPAKDPAQAWFDAKMSEREAMRAKQDAERYRWLRARPLHDDEEIYIGVDSSKHLGRWALGGSDPITCDTAIDAAMAAVPAGSSFSL